jgi:hypothetical protein
MTRRPLRRDWNGSFPDATECLSESSEHHVGVKLQLCPTAHAHRCESVPMLQVSERTLDRSASAARGHGAVTTQVLSRRRLVE